MKTAKDYLLETLKTHIACDDYKLFYIYTLEELKALQIIKELAKDRENSLYLFDMAEGLRAEDDKRIRALSQESLRDLFFVLKWLEKNGKGFVVFININPLLETDPKLCRAFKNLINNIIEKDLFLKLFIISPSSRVPEDLHIDAFFY